MQGVDLYAVGQLLGHKTPRMTQRYAHLSPKYMAEAVSKLDQVFLGTIPSTLSNFGRDTSKRDELRIIENNGTDPNE
jgi:hypothetical protein